MGCSRRKMHCCKCLLEREAVHARIWRAVGQDVRYTSLHLNICALDELSSFQGDI
jgi:hypothetical protein